MANSKKKSKAKKQITKTEPDSVFFMKMVLYFILGTVWVRLVGADDTSSFSIPVGLIFGVFIARHDHFQIDRKLEYVILFLSTILSFYLPIGLLV